MTRLASNAKLAECFASESLAADRSQFFLDLNLDHGRRVVRVTEHAKSRSRRIMIPANGLREMVSALNRIIALNGERSGTGTS